MFSSLSSSSLTYQGSGEATLSVSVICNHELFCFSYFSSSFLLYLLACCMCWLIKALWINIGIPKTWEKRFFCQSKTLIMTLCFVLLLHNSYSKISTNRSCLFTHAVLGLRVQNLRNLQWLVLFFHEELLVRRKSFWILFD